MTQLGFRQAIHQLYNEDIAPSDFFLFGWFKSKLARRLIVEMVDVFQAVSEMLGNLTIDRVRSIFLD
jgi:hypothetical protein